MKLKKTFILALSGTLALSSCNFLDVVPDGTPTTDDLFSSSLQVERYLYLIYDYMPNLYGFRHMPDFGAGGDVMSSPNGQTRYFRFKSMLYGLENSNNTYFGLWAKSDVTGAQNLDLYKGIRYAYDLIDNIDIVPNMSVRDKNIMVGECWFLIGYLHWTLMEHYGPIVLVTQEIAIDADDDQLFLPRSSWDECADFVCECFDKAADLLPATMVSSELGRATSVAAKAYKARVLMYTASPLVNGNTAFSSFVNYDGSEMIAQDYDKEKWKKALDAVNDAIEHAHANGHKLYEHAEAATLPDAERGRQNYYYAFLQKWNDAEFLFATGDHGSSTGFTDLQEFGSARHAAGHTQEGFKTSMVPTLQLVETFLTADGLPLADDPETASAYASNRLLSYDADGVADLHKNRDPRFYATVGYDRGTYIGNGKDDTVLKIRKGEYHGYDGVASHEYFSCTGYILQKFISKTTTYNETTKTISFADYSLPYMRLAELYLAYAEADFEYNGLLSSKGLEYLNKVRHRAGLPDFQTSWEKVGGMPVGDKLRSVLHQETMAELCCEARWYHDLRRWNEAESMLDGSPDVLNVDGADAASFYTIATMKEYSNWSRVFDYPKTNWLAVPMSEMDLNPKLVQNPGY